jgi:hypothetical protein
MGAGRWSGLAVCALVLAGSVLVPSAGAVTAATTTLKPLAMGVMPMNEEVTTGFPPAAWDPPIDHIARTMYWSQLEPSPGTFDFSPVEAALAANGGTKVKLRVLAGVHSPDWLKNRDGTNAKCPAPGGGIYLYFPWDRISGCVPRFWTDAFLTEYEKLMAAIAARYEANDSLLQVLDSACMTFWDEPFMLGPDLASNTRLFQAGFNKQTSEHCHDTGIAIHARVFPRTRTGLALNNGWDWPDGSSTGSGMTESWTEMRRLLNDYKAQLGPRLTLQYNGFSANTSCRGSLPTTSTAAPTMFCYLKGAPQPKGFQLRRYNRLVQQCRGVATPTPEACFRAAVLNALAFGAIFVEPHSEPDAEGNIYTRFDKQWITDRDAELEQRARAVKA